MVGVSPLRGRDPNQSMLIRFGPFTLDAEREELQQAGLAVRLPRQPFRILLLLAGRAGEIVTRDEIRAAIWDDGTHVDFEHGINAAIRQIRFVLDDRAGTPRYIRTFPRRGYSFIAPVERVAPLPFTRTAIQGSRVIAAVAPALAFAIAVLILFLAALREPATTMARGDGCAAKPPITCSCSAPARSAARASQCAGSP